MKTELFVLIEEKRQQCLKLQEEKRQQCLKLQKEIYLLINIYNTLPTDEENEEFYNEYIKNLPDFTEPK